MGTRVNFLRTGRFALTYRNMAIAVVALVSICLLVELGLMVQSSLAKVRVSAARKELTVLKGKQERQIRLMEVRNSRKQAGSVLRTLADWMNGQPPWTDLLNELAVARTDEVDLSNFSVGPQEGQSAGPIRVVIEGYATTAEAVAGFMERLARSSVYDQVLLSKSVRDAESGDKMRFTVTAAIKKRKR